MFQKYDKTFVLDTSVFLFSISYASEFNSFVLNKIGFTSFQFFQFFPLVSFKFCNAFNIIKYLNNVNEIVKKNIC